MWLNFPTNSQRILKVPVGHILIKLMGTLWKNSKGSFTKYPLGTLWTLCERTKWVCSKSTHWVLCWVLCKSAHHLPARYEQGELMDTFWKQPILTCQIFHWANWWVLFKSTQYLPTALPLPKLRLYPCIIQGLHNESLGLSTHQLPRSALSSP